MYASMYRPTSIKTDTLTESAELLQTLTFDGGHAFVTVSFRAADQQHFLAAVGQALQHLGASEKATVPINYPEK